MIDNSIAPPWFAPLRSGLIWEVGSMEDLIIASELMVNGEYEYAVSRMLNTTILDIPLHIVDLGANVGYFTLYVANRLLLAGHDFLIDAVEGCPTTANEFISRMRKQRVPHLVNKVTLHQGLAGFKSGKTSLSLYPQHSINHVTFPDGVNSPSETGTCEAHYLDLNKLIEGPIDLMKVDIEGLEQVLVNENPDLFARTQRCVFEMHNPVCDVQQTRQRLKDYGFHYRELVRDGDTITIEYFER